MSEMTYITTEPMPAWNGWQVRVHKEGEAGRIIAVARTKESAYSAGHLWAHTAEQGGYLRGPLAFGGPHVPDGEVDPDRFAPVSYSGGDDGE